MSQQPPRDPQTSATGLRIATLRTPGYDVARALAVLGMVLVNFRGVLMAADRGSGALVWFADRLEGKAGALFVLLAGVGVALRTHRGEIDEDPGIERRALLERAGILLILGLLLMHLWEWDILHFHAVYLLLAIPLLHARSTTLWILAGASIWITVILHHELDWGVRPSLATLPGALRHAFFNGLYPVFPWFSFVLVGMAVGRLDLTCGRTRRRTLTIALALVVLTETIDTLGRYDIRSGALGMGEHAALLLTWPRAPRPLFVVSAAAIGVAIVCICIGLTQRRANHAWVMALVATGQLALTLYAGHVIAILLPIEHGLLNSSTVEVALAFGLAYYAVAIAFAVWWRRRWEYGPLEGLIRQVTRRHRAGPWGGARLR